jgi:hypothetical protein
MRVRGIHPAGRRIVAAVLCAPFVLTCLAGPVAAATVTFGTPTATSQFGQQIVFTQPYGGAAIKSASILITLPDDPGPAVASVSNSGSGSLTYKMDTSSGGVDPFVPVVGQFEVVLADGTTLDGPEIKITYDDDRFTWKTKIGKVVRLHYIDATDSFAQQMLNLADAGVANAASLFGVSETQPLDYYVYPSQADFQQGLNQPDTVGGTVVQSVRICYATVQSGDTVYAAQVMPHEPTHVVFWDATHNPYHEMPRWLNEGFAQYVSQGYDPDSRQIVSQAARAGTLPSLLALTDYFPLDSGRIYLVYAEAVAAADFLVRKYGRPSVAKLLQAFGKGATDDEAFTAALGVDVATFDKAFMTDNNATSTKYGPKPEATSPAGTFGSSGPTASPPTTGPARKAPARSDNSAAYLLAAIMAVAGVVLLGLALAMVVSSRRQAAR